MKYLIIICCLTIGVSHDALCATEVATGCVDGYTLTDDFYCKITCQPGYYVATPGGQCIRITERTTYTDAPHTIAYGETSDAFLKKCPKSASGGLNVYIPDVWLHSSITYCTDWVENLRMSQKDRYESVNCDTANIYSCYWKTHGVGAAQCYYTTGTDGSAIYDNQRTDPVTGEGRRECVGGSYLYECDAGYYAPYQSTGDALQHHPCNPVGTAYWSPAKDINRYECPVGTATCGFGECADSADDCLPYKTLKISGHGDILLWSEPRSEKSLAVMYPDGTIYYGMMTPAAQPRGLHIKYPDGKIYTVLSPTDSFVTYGADTLMFD